MDYPMLKNLMRNYLGDIVDSEELQHLFLDDPNVYYYYSRVFKSKGFTHLHKCVMLTNKYPNLNDYLEEYLKICDNINETNECGRSALHLSCNNSNIYSTERTVEILIAFNININLQDNSGWTALHYAIYYCYSISTIRTNETLIFAGSDIFNLKDNYGNTCYDLFNIELRNYFQIDKATQTIGIKTGKLTKCAKK